MATFDGTGATSHEIAHAGGLDERYVREWLAVMVTSRVVEYTPEDRRYRLPPEHAKWLTRAGGTGTLGFDVEFGYSGTYSTQVHGLNLPVVFNGFGTDEQLCGGFFSRIPLRQQDHNFLLPRR